MNPSREERGFALLITLICSTLFMLLGLSLTFSSMTEFRTSTEFEAREQSLMVADAGFNLTQGIFRGNSLTGLLASATDVNRYLNFPVPTGTTELSYFNRNPLSPIEAMHTPSAGRHRDPDHQRPVDRSRWSLGGGGTLLRPSHR